MGAYGAATPKPTQLRGSPLWLSLLKKPLDRAAFKAAEASRPQVVKELQPHADGKRRVSGEKDTLKATQEYPEDYAKAVFTNWSSHRDLHTQVIDSTDEEDSSDLDFEFEPWHEGHFEADAAFMGMQPDELPAGLGMR